MRLTSDKEKFHVGHSGKAACIRGVHALCTLHTIFVELLGVPFGRHLREMPFRKLATFIYSFGVTSEHGKKCTHGVKLAFFNFLSSISEVWAVSRFAIRSAYEIARAMRIAHKPIKISICSVFFFIFSYVARSISHDAAYRKLNSIFPHSSHTHARAVDSSFLSSHSHLMLKCRLDNGRLTIAATEFKWIMDDKKKAFGKHNTLHSDVYKEMELLHFSIFLANEIKFDPWNSISPGLYSTTFFCCITRTTRILRTHFAPSSFIQPAFSVFEFQLMNVGLNVNRMARQAGVPMPKFSFHGVHIWKADDKMRHK